MPDLLKSIPLMIAAAFAVTTSASAHAHLVSAVPADKSVVAAAPSELQLKFSEPVNPAKSGIVVNGPDKAAIRTAEPAPGASDPTTLVIPISQPMAAGDYTVMWHTLSADGHKGKGQFSFTIKP